MALAYDLEFRRPVPRFDAKAAARDVLAALEEDGAAIIERLIEGEPLARLDADLDPWFAAAPEGEGVFFGRHTRRFGGLFAKAPSAQALAIHPLVLEVFEGLLRGPNPAAPICDHIELSATQAIGIGPGEKAQFLHRDEGLWPFEHAFEVLANAMWAVRDFTAANGATRMILGSHKWPMDRHPQPGDTVVAHAPAGSVILWSGKLLHGGGANRTAAIRRGFVLSYKLGWLAPQEKLLVTHPPEVARAFPERLQRLIGYQLHRPNLGWIEGRDPLEWLNGARYALAATRDNLLPAHEELLAEANSEPSAFAGYLS